jgi:hypothetical protein
MSITLEQVSFRYFDARNGQALKLSNVDGLLQIAADGGVSFRGSAVINSQVTRIDLSLKSLPRVNADGSPLELAIESNAASANFSGRLATAKVLSLAGPLSLSSPAPDVMARWAGLPLTEGLKLPGPLHLNGALDSAGRALCHPQRRRDLRRVPRRRRCGGRSQGRTAAASGQSRGGHRLARRAGALSRGGSREPGAAPSCRFRCSGPWMRR